MFEPLFSTDLTLKGRNDYFFPPKHASRKASPRIPAVTGEAFYSTSLSTKSGQPLESVSPSNCQPNITFESSSGGDQSSRPKVSSTLPPLPAILAKAVLEGNFVDVPAEGEQLLFLKDFFQSSLTEEDIHFFWVENLIVLSEIYQ